MSLYSSMTLAQMTTNVRNDLGDTGSPQRWSDTIIQREIDRALDKYSQVYPNITLTQIPTISYSRLYAIPSDPVMGTPWYVDRVEYPIGRWPKQYNRWFERISPKIFDPVYTNAYFTGVPQLSLTRVPGGGSLSAGVYKYAFGWVVPGLGYTLPLAPTISVTCSLNDAVTVGNIPTGPYGVSDIQLYRSQAGGSSLFSLAAMGTNAGPSGSGNSNNTVGLLTYTDTLADGSLGSAAPSSNTTAGIAQFEIQLDYSRVPVDASGLIEVTGAYKHELDSGGTSIQERHWDCIALGAEAFCLYQYLVGTNDNFEYVDGQFRDRVDDTKAPDHWYAQAKDAMDRFKARLEVIRDEWESGAHAIPQWGDKPIRWDRL